MWDVVTTSTDKINLVLCEICLPLLIFPPTQNGILEQKSAKDLLCDNLDSVLILTQYKKCK